MKVALSLVVAAFLAMTAYGNGLSHVELDGKSYTNISKAYLGAGGKVIIIFPDGGTSADPSKLPAEFLDSWNISDASLTAAKNAKAAQDENVLDRAIQSGYFREVDGVVYDIRKRAHLDTAPANMV